MKRTPFTKDDFAWALWKPADIERIGKEVVRLKKERYEKILAVPAEERTFENTIIALEESGSDLADWMGQIELIGAVSPDKKVRDASTKVSEEVGKAMVEIEFDRRLYEAVEAYAGKKEKLVGPDKILFEDTRKGYARMGFALPKEKQAELKRNLKRMTALSLKFDQRLNEHRDQILVSLEELDGLPETYIKSLRKDAKGRYIVSLDYPELVPFMSSAHSNARRKELYEKKLRKGGPQNLKIIEELFSLRARNAKLLGYKSYADYVTEVRMSKSATRVEKFLDEIERKTRKAGAKDYRELEAFKRKVTGNPKAKIEIHDTAYYFKLLRKEKFNIDSDFVKEHFPFEHVKQATLDAYQKLFGVKFVRREGIVFWHPDVQLYDVYDAKKGYFSSFALDLYPREGKYGHAAVFPVMGGRQEGNEYIRPFPVMVTNFQKPTAANPSLMSHGEVETFFHEFGHVVHGALTEAKYQSQSGTNTARDFVEAPSQMLENWVWEAGMLKKLSKHYKTGKPLPADLIKRILDAKLFAEAWSTRGQLVLAKMDMLLHSKAYANPNTLYPRLEKEYLGLTAPKTQLYLAGFGHIAHGYEAGYYGYLWSKVYAEDMFTRFAKEGVLNPKTGKAYRDWVLAKGSSMEEEKLVEGFLGRKPNNKAFLKSIGA